MLGAPDNMNVRGNLLRKRPPFQQHHAVARLRSGYPSLDSQLQYGRSEARLRHVCAWGISALAVRRVEMNLRPPGPTKRQKELARAEKKKEKEARKEQRRKEKEEQMASGVPGEDPDLAGIVPGPQPPLE